MRNIKLTIEYDGSNYSGWQAQGNTQNTVQCKIETVLSRLFDEKTSITGSGRTDAGVHAYCQVANFFTNSNLDTREIQEYCYDYLPHDIFIKKVEEVAPRFNARISAKKKLYIYRIWNHKFRSVFERKYLTHIAEPLNVDKMIKAAQIFVGEHDFRSFTKLVSKKKSTIRIILSLNITKTGNIIEIRAEGNGLLYKMVRMIVGALIDVGLSKISIDELKTILEKKDPSIIKNIAPPMGLFLASVDY